MILSLHEKIATLAEKSQETGLERINAESGCVIPAEFIQRLEARTRRKCVACGDEFEAIGLQAYCDPCGIVVDQQAAAPPVRKLDSSWPRLHADKLDSMSGPGKAMADKLAPRLFGNRLLVLAGDRGRGKTQIATAIAYHRLVKGHDSGLYVRAFDLVTAVSGLEKAARLAAFQRVPFLCIDEAHACEPKFLPLLESICDERYANRRPTMLIGNWMTPEGIHSGEEVNGRQINGLGETIMDRINEHTANKTGGVVWCRWNTYRAAPAKPREADAAEKF